MAAGQADGAVADLERSAENGDAQAAIELAVWYLEGRLIARDLRLARDWFARAGEIGSVAGENVFIAFLANGIGGEADWSAAAIRLRALAQRDEGARRQLELISRMELTGDGHPIEPARRRQLSEQPEAWAYQELFSADECGYLIDAARPLLQPSVIVDPASGGL